MKLNSKYLPDDSLRSHEYECVSMFCTIEMSLIDVSNAYKKEEKQKMEIDSSQAESICIQIYRCTTHLHIFKYAVCVFVCFSSFLSVCLVFYGTYLYFTVPSRSKFASSSFFLLLGCVLK